MKRPSLKNKLRKDKSSTDDQITEAIVDALSENDKVIEIRPAKQSKGMGLKRLLLLGAGAIGLAYWVQNSQKADDLIESAKEKTANRIHQAEETIEEGSETASEQIEAGSERAGEAVQEASEKVADRTEEAGKAVQEASEKASDRTEEAGDKAADRTKKADEKKTNKSDSGASSPPSM